MASGWLGAYPPPPGVTPNFDDPPSQIPGGIALHTVCLTLVTAAVAMRVYTRTRITRTKLGIDDYFCILSYFLTVAFSGLMIKCFTLGIGRHIWDEPAPWLFEALKYFTIASYIYLVLATTIKLTFLFFYYRLFSLQTKTRFFITFGIVFVACLNTALFFATVFECSPIQRQWNATVPGRCINPVILPYLSGASSSATDLYVLILPVRLLCGLNVELKRKLKILVVFAVGLFACVASLVRLGMTPILQSDFDATWNIATIGLWATLEVNVGIICSCVMLLPAFLDHHLPASIHASLSRLWSYTVSLIPRGSKDSETPSFVNPGGRNHHHAWPGYKHQLSSESQPKDLAKLHSLQTHNLVLEENPLPTTRNRDIPADAAPSSYDVEAAQVKSG
ncbi:hypothetical protein QBC46DRAFT_400152 [Diplogelasinospora grovesii]|uniref:Rhodopsin domain-containing protein n=1 Tax=Diplogelasinospora grovesii TaxID=303347 RepID=A0AAN6MVY4_9PEZI|nr:hypothetical protein QBC46DRAFT_400152 [Diplogelasinospora grovesii]